MDCFYDCVVNFFVKEELFLLIGDYNIIFYEDDVYDVNVWWEDVLFC